MTEQGRAVAHFYMGTLQNEDKSREAGRPIFDDVPYVRIQIVGDKDLVIDKPVWDDPSNPNSHTARFPEQWERFKKGMLDEVSQQGGTPLALMPGITGAQVKELEYFKCRTVEQLAGMSDANTMKFPGMLKLREEARAYIERAQGAAPEKKLREELEKRDNEIDTLKRQLSELSALVKKSKS